MLKKMCEIFSKGIMFIHWGKEWSLQSLVLKQLQNGFQHRSPYPDKLFKCQGGIKTFQTCKISKTLLPVGSFSGNH